jgi:MFS family permease
MLSGYRLGTHQHSRLTHVGGHDGCGSYGTYTGLYYLFSTLALIVGSNVNGWIVELTGYNYNLIMLFAPISIAIACVLMLGVRKGESRQQTASPSPLQAT